MNKRSSAFNDYTKTLCVSALKKDFKNALEAERKKSRTAEELQCGLAEEETRLVAKLVTGNSSLPQLPE